MNRFKWNDLPWHLRQGLLAGGAGRAHLAGLAQASLHAARSHARDVERSSLLARLGFDLLLAAWEEDPLNGALAVPLLTLGGNGLGPDLRRALEWLGTYWKPQARVERMALRGDVAGLLELLRSQGREGRADPQLLRSWLETVLVEGDPESLPAVLDHLERFGWQGPALLPARLARAHALAAVAPADAVDELRALAELLPLPGRLEELGHGLYHAGEREQALQCWAKSLAARPWSVNLTLRARDVLQRLDREAVPLAGECSILLYSWNKAHDLERCFAALEATSPKYLHSARIVALDNGSSDCTPEVLRRWQERWGADRFSTVRLDVNVGAPAARNWLLAREDVRARPWTLFLDDDALVPADWLGRLGAAVQRFPGAGVWGCTVVDAGRPWVVQNADLHLRGSGSKRGKEDGGQDSRVNPAPSARTGGQPPAVPLTDIQHQGPALGRFDSLRTCVSVTGCCHLFRTATLVEQGGFDIRYSPSQFDDLDRDLRAAAQGGYAVCQGFLHVEHLKRSGTAARRGVEAASSGQGNLVKLLARFGASERERMAREQAARVQGEVERARRELEQTLETRPCP